VVHPVLSLNACTTHWLQCPLWVKSRHCAMSNPCRFYLRTAFHKNFARDTELPRFPLGPGSIRFYLRKRTLTPTVGMSPLCANSGQRGDVGCAATVGERVASRSVWVLQRSRHSTDWDCKTHDCPPAHSADIALLSYIDSPNRHYLRQS
jgi:hypothetical protein